MPQRTCVGCRTARDKKDLIRIVHTPEDEYRIDPGGKLPGRGAYLCRSAECLARAAKTEALSKAFRCKVPAAALERLMTEVRESV